MNLVTVYFFSVRIICYYKLILATDPFAGFSRGAYQVRVLSAMIEKVRYLLHFL